jgi:MOB kinase activator 1
MAQAVKLPPNENINEWLAINSMFMPRFIPLFINIQVFGSKLHEPTSFFVPSFPHPHFFPPPSPPPSPPHPAVDFFNELNLIYGTVQQTCTEENCPTMNAGPGYEYLWQDPVRFPTPTEMSAPKYVDHLMEWAESQINDDSLFPLTPGTEFPRDFKKRISTIFRRFFRVYGHIYHRHLDDIITLSADQHLHTCFKHFALFCLEFNLVPPVELEPLQDVIKSCTKK